MSLTETTTIRDLSSRENLPQSNSGREGGVLDTLSGEHVSASRPISGKRIPLTQGQFAIVDDDDYEELSQYKWQAHWNPGTHSFYVVRSEYSPNGTKSTVLMHRHILGLELGDGKHTDHIDHNTLDNRRANIRIVTRNQNQHNRREKGYYWNKHAKKYAAQIRVDGIRRFLGYYNDPQEAHAAYLAAKRIYHPSAPIPEALI